MNINYIIGGVIVLILLPIDFILFWQTRWFYSSIVLTMVFGILPGFLSFLKENKRQKEIEEQFLGFVRALVENVRSGIPISGSILRMKDKDYGALSPYIRKLANQVEWGIPMREAFLVFARDTKNKVIRRSIAIVIQAQESGGYMEDILQAVSDSVVSVNRLKQERKSSVFNQIVQGYIVFFIFIVIMLILEVKLMPMIEDMVAGMAGGGLTGVSLLEGVTSGAEIKLNFKRIFLSLILIQGLFAGLMIGKFSEGSIKYGIKHSFLLIVASLLLVLTFAPI